MLTTYMHRKAQIIIVTRKLFANVSEQLCCRLWEYEHRRKILVQLINIRRKDGRQQRTIFAFLPFVISDWPYAFLSLHYCCCWCGDLCHDNYQLNKKQNKNSYEEVIKYDFAAILLLHSYYTRKLIFWLFSFIADMSSSRNPTLIYYYDHNYRPQGDVRNKLHATKATLNNLPQQQQQQRLRQSLKHTYFQNTTVDTAPMFHLKCYFRNTIIAVKQIL